MISIKECTQAATGEKHTIKSQDSVIGATS